jgi:hypothetical protein
MSKQINKNITKLARLDYWWVSFFKVLAAQENRTIKDLMEECFSDYYDLEDFKKVNEKKIH